LLNTGALGLETEGIAPDSLRRLLGLLSGDQVPASVRGFPSDRSTEQGLVLGSLDFAPPSSASGQSLDLTFNGSWNRASPATPLTTALPTSAYNTTNWLGAAQLHHTGYFGFVLSETGLGVAESHRYLTPYLDLPSGNVLVDSDFGDGTSSVQSIAFGG